MHQKRYGEAIPVLEEGIARHVGERRRLYADLLVLLREARRHSGGPP